MKRILNCFLLIIVAIIFVSCDVLQTQSTKSNKYSVPRLSIGIIGEKPEVLESQINFAKIQFNDLETEKLNVKYDAVIITKNNLSEASQEKYKLIYKKSNLPFFFIENKKSHIPFTDEKLSYDEVPDLEDLTYATGIVYNNNRLKSWGYGLYNDVENEDNIKDVYSRIFDTISKNKMSLT